MSYIHKTRREAKVSRVNSNGRVNIDTVDYDGYVYCPTVSTGLWYSRRNGKVIVTGNCSVRTGIGDKNRANAPDDDYGLLIQDSIEDAFSLLPTHNITFKRPLKWEESVVHNGVGFTHGHLAKTPKNVAQWFKNQAAGKRSNLHEARILAYGHFHHLHMEETADAVLLLGAPALEGGSDYFTNSTGDRSNPGMLTFDTENGHLKGWHVYRPTTEVV